MTVRHLTTTGALAVALAAGVATAPGATAAATPAAAAPSTFVALTDPDLGPSAVAVFDATSGEELRRLTPEAPGGGPSEPQLTANGRAVVYSAGAGTCAADIYRVAVDGRSEPELLVRGALGPAHSPALQPGGNRIAYLQEHCDDGSRQLVVRRHRTGGPAVSLVQATGDQHLRGPRWSADGWLAFTTTGEGAGLHAMPARPGAMLRSADDPAGCAWSSADWYTDARGRQRVLASADCGTSARWFVLNRGMDVLRTLATMPAQRGAQAVSVDASGTQAVYQETPDGALRRTWTWDFLSGAAPQQVATGPMTPSWH